MLVLSTTASTAVGGVHLRGTTDGAAHVHLITTLQGEDVGRNAIRTIREYSYATIVSSGATIVKNSGGSFGGYTILSSGSTGVLSFHDSSTGSTAAQQIGPQVGLSSAAESLLAWGKRFGAGLTVFASGSPTTSQTMVWFN